jgi:outer membrane protein assembly factor BamA
MKKFSFAIAFALVFAAPAFAQTDSSTQPKPCGSDTVGRPLLKLRIPTTKRQPEPENVQVSDKKPCENTSDSINEQPLMVEFEGLTAVPESDLRKYMRERRIAQTLDSISDGTAAAEAAIREIFVDHGYRHAQVSSRLDHRDNETTLTFVISEGPRFEISNIRFQGNRVFSEQVLTARTKECLVRYRREADTVDVFRPEVFDYCLHNLANFERSQGYLQARFGESRAQEIGEMLEISVESNEGVVYRLRNLEIEGADHVSEQQVRDLIDMRAGDVVNGEKLAKALYETLKAAYGEKGFIQYTAEIEPEFHSQQGTTDGIADFKITIDEGRRFKISRISFQGEDVPQNEVRGLLLVREGDVYNQRLFEESVRKINETGLFYPMDKDKDVDFSTTEEEGLVSLRIKLFRKGTSAAIK